LELSKVSSKRLFGLIVPRLDAVANNPRLFPSTVLSPRTTQQGQVYRYLDTIRPSSPHSRRIQQRHRRMSVSFPHLALLLASKIVELTRVLLTHYQSLVFPRNGSSCCKSPESRRWSRSRTLKPFVPFPPSKRASCTDHLHSSPVQVMDIVNFYQSAGLADPSNAKADVWEKMKGAAGGESPEELDRPLGAGMTEEGGSRSRSGSGSEGASGMPKYSSPVRPVFGLFTLRR
jgi:hypothetical protein